MHISKQETMRYSLALSRVVSARKNLGQIYTVKLGSCWELCFKIFPSFRETISTECIIRILIFSPIRPSCVKFVYSGRLVVSNHLTKRGVNRGMQIRRSVVFLGPIRRSDLIFVQIRIRVTLKIFRGI